MGIEDRDYYREWWRKRTGYVEKAPFRLPEKKPKREWHPVLTILLFSIICVTTYAAIQFVGSVVVPAVKAVQKKQPG